MLQSASSIFSDMNALLIVNPVSGQGRTQDVSALRAALAPFAAALVVTQGPGDAEAAACRAAADGFGAVLVAGGDGTINEVVNGLMAGRTGDAPSLPLGIIPVGTQNVLAHELGLPTGDLPALAALLRAGHTRPIDLGRADDRFFALMAGFGFDAAVVNEVIQPVKDVIGAGAYALATMQALARYQSTTVRLTLDNEQTVSEAFVVVVANGASYAFRHLKMAPFASLDDGWLDVCVFERPFFDKVGFVAQVVAMFARRHLQDPRVRYYRARRVVIHSEPPMPGQLDGEPFRPTPLTIEVVPNALSVFVPHPP